MAAKKTAKKVSSKKTGKSLSKARVKKSAPTKSSSKKKANKASEKRCSWCLGSEIYIDYHDKEWGVPCYDSNELLEMICLEGQQAGLSWITILNKRENYRRLFAKFDAKKIARFTEAKIDKLAENPGIIRYRMKVEAIVQNAKMVAEMEKQGENFAEYLWSFVDNTPIQNKHKSMKTVQASTDISVLMSKALKKRGFKFVGPTTCYAFMQAAGMVNDHMVDCPGYKKAQSLAKQTSPFKGSKKTKAKA